MRNPIRIVLIFIILSALLLASCGQAAPEETQERTENNTPVDVYAVIAAKDDYSDVGMSNLLVDYIDLKRMRDALLDLGWDQDQIHSLKGFDQESLKAELDWLEENVDSNDLVLFYVTGHGNYLNYHVHWNSFFPEEWSQISSYQRVLIVDSCSAALFTDSIKDDPNPHISIAAVDDDEYGWNGIKEEGLPIIGGIFTFYFTEALGEMKADTDGDGMVSVQEAALYAEEKQRAYMHDIVLVVPEFLEDYHSLGARPEKDKTFPDVIMDDAVGYQLDLRAGE